MTVVDLCTPAVRHLVRFYVTAYYVIDGVQEEQVRLRLRGWLPVYVGWLGFVLLIVGWVILWAVR